MEVEITTENFESYKNGELPLVVDLWATWCGPCRMLAPTIKELADDYDGKIVVGKCDVEENDDIAMQFGVRNIPTILFFKADNWSTSSWAPPQRTCSTRSSRLCSNPLYPIWLQPPHRDFYSCPLDTRGFFHLTRQTAAAASGAIRCSGSLSPTFT